MTIARRSILNFAALAMASSPWPLRARAQYNDPVAAEKWLARWMASLGAASGALHLGRFADRMYFLREPIKWTPNAKQSGLPTVDVPVGFVTDFASIPRIFWSALPPDGTYTYPAIIHDYLYWMQPVGRGDADLIFKHVMEEFKIDATTIATIYSGVRLGGASAWDDNRAKKSSGEKRVLKKFPKDPTLTWPQWKVQSVF